MASGAITYERHRPEATTLYQVVQENLVTLYGAVDEGAVKVALPRFVKKELEGYLECGLLCRGFARLRCEGCTTTRLVAFSCKGRGFCPSCLGRKMCATAANLVEHVLPGAPLRQWVLTVPFAWRKRLGYDGPMLGAFVRKLADEVLSFYRRRAARDGVDGQSGAVLVVQRTSSDLRLNPHVHAVFLDGVYSDDGESVTFHPLGRLSTAEVESVLEDAALRMTRYLRRRGLLDDARDAEDTEGDSEASGLAALAATAASGMTPPGGPVFRRGALPSPRSAADFDRHLAVGRGGFTLHAATQAGAADARGRETEADLGGEPGRHVIVEPRAHVVGLADTRAVEALGRRRRACRRPVRDRARVVHPLARAEVHERRAPAAPFADGDGVEQGKFRSDLDVRIAVKGLFGMLNWTSRWYTPGESVSAEKIAETF